MTQPAPIISSMGNDADMAELIDMYVEEMGGRVASLRRAATAADWSALANEAHKLRGSAGGHGFAQIGDAAGRLEDGLRAAARGEGAAEAMKAQVDDLIAMCMRARAR